MKAGREADSLSDFQRLVHTRRYTEARIRRLLLWAFLGLTAAELPPAVPYLRVLGASGRGRARLREMKGKSSLPVLTRPARARALPAAARRLFELESRWTDLYALCFSRPRPCALEWTTSPVLL